MDAEKIKEEISLLESYLNKDRSKVFEEFVSKRLEESLIAYYNQLKFLCDHILLQSNEE